jgi:hypothetical protein
MGLKLAKGNFVNFVDSDDLLLPDKIERQLEIFSNDPTLGMIVCKTRYFRESPANQLELLQKIEFTKDSDFLECYLSRLGVWCTNSALIKKSLIGEHTFKEGQVDAHEWLFFLVLMLGGMKVSAVNDIGVLKRIHSQSIGNLTMRLKLPSLLEARLLILDQLLKIQGPDQKKYMQLLLADLNSHLRTTAKVGHFRLYCKTILSLN